MDIENANKRIIKTTSLYCALEKEEKWYLKQCLEKQIPQQIKLTDTEGTRCPECGNEVSSNNTVYYCYKCGQRLE